MGYSKELVELESKLAQPFELGLTAKTYIEDLWLYHKYEYLEIIWTDEIMKGLLHEQDAIGLLCEIDEIWRKKNEVKFHNEYFTGTPDVILSDVVEDIKTSWDLRTFFRVKQVPDLYNGQAQVYMYLTGKKKFKLHYCLINTDESLIQSAIKRVFYKFGSSEENPHFTEYLEALYNNHRFDSIPIEKRVKTFDIDFDESYIKELEFRAKKGREYYNTLSL